MSATTIWKFVVPIEDQPTVMMPGGARILSVGYQEPDIVIWALVEPKGIVIMERPLTLRGTGHPADGLGDLPFIGTVRVPPGMWFHLWDGVPA